MAERFNLTAQLQLQAPRNVGQVVGQIKRQLQGVTANVQVKGDARAVAKVNKELRNVDKSARGSAAAVGKLNRNLSEAARRFSVITVATGTMLAFAHAVKNAVGEAISFERELVKISQVSGKSVKNLQGLTKEITRLSTSLGASSSDLLNVSRILTQAGFSAQKTKQALDILAKTSLGATFDDIRNTTEGAIAVLRQFRAEAQRAGGDIKFLEQTMDAINAVSKRFAVESNDLISVVRRVGGVFETAGGSVNELIALFTSVRATTRETAETIATGLRTIFTRIQRTETVDMLKQLGIELRNAQGQFVGSYEAVRRLSEGLAGLDPRDFRFSQIVEQLGGFRQIGKVIPMIRQFTTAQQALNVAQAASGSVTKDAITAQQSLAVQAARVKEEFSALMRNFADSSTFRSVAKGALELARAFIKIADALTPMIPLLTTLMAMKIGSALAPGLGMMMGMGRGRGRATGGKIHKFSTGGFVPGVGNSDSVPAMLQPGEFVIKKSSAQKLGASSLHAMNRYNKGGRVAKIQATRPQNYGVFALNADKESLATEGRKVDRKTALDRLIPQIVRKEATKGAKAAQANLVGKSGAPSKGFSDWLHGTKKISTLKPGTASAYKAMKPATQKSLQKEYLNSRTSKTKGAQGQKSDITGVSLKGPFNVLGISGKNNKGELMQDLGPDFEKASRAALKVGVKKIAQSELVKNLNIPPIKADEQKLFNFNGLFEGAQETLEGYLLEGVIGALTAAKIGGGGINFDFPKLTKTAKTRLKKLFGENNAVDLMIAADAKRTASSATSGENSIQNKIASVLEFADFQLLNRGGAVDSVPAMLTPGEYVINRSSAQAIGYSNLNKMNKTGVQHFANGGVVQYMSNGGKKITPNVTPGQIPGRTGAGLKMKGGVPQWSAKLAKDAANVGKVLQLTAAQIKKNKVEAHFKALGHTGARLEKAMDVATKAMSSAKGTGKAVGMQEAVRRGDAVIRNPMRHDELGRPKQGGAIAAPRKLRGAERVGGVAETRAAGSVPAPHIKASAASRTAGMQAIIETSPSARHLEAARKQYVTNLKAGMSAQNAMNNALKVGAQAHKQSGGISKEGLQYAKQLNTARQTLAQKLGAAAKTAGGNVVGSKVAGRAMAPFKAAGTGLRAAVPFGEAGKAARQRIGAGARKLPGGARDAAKAVSGTASAMQQFVFLGAAVTSVTSQMSSLSDTTKQAINETAGFATGMVGIAGTVINTLTNLVVSNVAAAASEDAETQSNIRAASMGSKVGGAFSALLVVVTVAMTALKYLSASQKAMADEARKKWTNALNKISKEGGGDADEITKSMQAEMAARHKSAELFGKTALMTTGSFIAAGAGIGALLGGPLGAGIGAAAGGLMGVWQSSKMATNAVDAARDARIAEIKAIRGTIESFISLRNTQKKLKDTLADIDASGLSAEKQLDLRLKATGEAVGKREVSRGGAQSVTEIARIAKTLGATSAEVLATGGDEKKLKDLAKKNGQSTQAAINASTALGAALMQRKALEEAASDQVKATSANYAKATDAIRSAANFTELNKAMPRFKKALADNIAAIEEKSSLEIRIAQETLDSTDVSNKTARASAQQALNDAKKRRSNALKMANLSAKQAVNATRKRIKEDLLAAKAAESFRKAMVASSKFMRAFGAVTDANTKREKQLKGQQALIENKDLDFSITQAQGLGDLTMIRDLKKFDRELKTSIADLPPTLRKEALKLARGVKETAVLVTKGKEFLVGKRIGPRDKAPSAVDILKSVGIDPTKQSASVIQQVQKQVEKAFSDRVLDANEFDEIFKPLISIGQDQAKKLSAIQNEVNRALGNHARALNNQLAVLEKRRAAELNMIDIQNKNEVMLAKARGADDADIGKILDRQERKRAQAALGGVGVRAGDIGGAVAAREAAEKRRAEIEKERHNMNLSTDARKKLMTEDKKMQIVIQRTTAEIKRLGNQSEKAGRLMDQIDAERAKREVLTGLVTDFVVGGQEERRAMQKSVMGIQFAVATGTLQNQSPEQRQATVGMLDKLADIEIPGAGGMTGKEVKQKLVFDDAVRMGLDPKIAKQLATATSKEEKLIKALESLTKVMEAANKAEAEGKAMGGLIHLAGGGSTIFKPRGTDTVPAMLTPGEFVIKKSSVDKYGVGMMSAINAGRFANGGRVSYLQDGGKSSFWQSTVPRYKTTRIYHDEKHPDAMPGTSRPTPTWQRAKKSSGPTHRGSASEVVTVGGRKYPNRFWPSWEEWGDKYGPDHGLLSLFRFKDWNKNQGPGFLKANEFGDPATESFNPFGFKRSFADVIGPKQHAYQKRMNKLRWMEEQERKKKLEEAARRKFNFASGGVVYASLGGGPIPTTKEIERRKAIEERMAPLKKASMRTTLGPSPLGPALNFLGNLGVEKIKQRAGFGAKTPVPEPTVGPSRLGGQVTPAVQKAYDEMQRNKKRGSWMEAFGFAEGGFIEVPYFSRKKMKFQEPWNLTKPFVIIDGLVIPKNKAAAYRSRKKAIQVANAMKKKDWKRVLQLDPKNKKALQMRDAAERAARVEESRRKHAKTISQLERLIKGKPSSPKGPGFSRPEPRRNILDIPSQGMSQHGVSPIELFDPEPPEPKSLLPKRRMDAGRRRTRKPIEKTFDLGTTFDPFMFGAGEPTATKRKMPDVSGIGIPEDPRNVAAQRAINRANREEALFKAQQARQAPAQPAQTRGMPFAFRSQESFDRAKEQRDKRHRIIAWDQPEWYRKKHYNNSNSPYYRMTISQARKKQKAKQIIKDRALEKGAARRRRLGKSEFTQQFRNRFERADMKAQQRRQRLQMRYGQRFADGGQVDSVPAMLTPGEFVMNRDAVQRYGTGFMSRLNRGNLPGFNNGGVVGAKYFQNGSTSAVKQGGGFNFGSLAGMLDTMTKAFPTLNNVITKLQNVFSDLNMTHNFKGDMSLAFSVTNTDALKQSIADAITPHISDLITRELDNRFGGFNATGT